MLRRIEVLVLILVCVVLGACGSENKSRSLVLDPLAIDEVDAEGHPLDSESSETNDDSRVDQEPVVEESVTDTVTVIVDEPIVDEPISDQPIADEPIADEPIVDDAPPVEPAVFELNVTVSSGGSVTGPGIECGMDCGESYTENNVINLIAVADEDYRFDGWQMDCSGTDACALTLDQNRTVMAVFSPEPPVPPSTPSNLAVQDVTDSSIELSWGGVVTAESYQIFRDGEAVGTVQVESFIDSGLSANQTYSYEVYSLDTEGVRSDAAAMISVSTLMSSSTCDFDGETLNHHFKVDEFMNGNLVTDEFSTAAGIADNVSIIAGGVFGQALLFPLPDIESRVELGSFAPDVSGGLSVALWIKPSSLESTEARFVSKANGDASANHDLMVGAINSTALRFRLRIDGSTTTLVSETGLLSLDKWSHVVATFDEEKMKIYHDGDLVASASAVGLVDFRDNTDMALGNQPSGLGDRQYSGLMDDVRFYQGALTDSEVQNLYLSGTTDCSAGGDAIVVGEPQDLTVLSNIGFVELSWKVPAEMGSDISHYQLFRDQILLADHIQSLTYTDTTGSVGSNYVYAIRAISTDGSLSPFSSEVTTSVVAEPDLLPPSIPSALQAQNVTDQTATLTWSGSTDIGGGEVAGYKVYRNDLFYRVVEASKTSFIDTGLSPNTDYVYAVTAIDNSDNESQSSNELTVSTLAAVPVEEIVVIKFGSEQEVKSSGGTGGVGKGDLDKDGRIEFIAGKLSIFDWTESGWVEHKVTTGSGKLDRFAGDNEVLDVNNDGWLDLIITDSSNGGKEGELLWYENPQGNLAGEWVEHSIHVWPGSGSGGSIRHCEEAVADINNDGFNDIAVRDINYGSWVFINNKNGGFYPPTYLSHRPREGLDLADLDDDGDLDIVVNGIWFETPADAVNGDYILHSIPGMEAWYPSGSTYSEMRDYAAKVRSADFNEDGKMDILISNSEELSGSNPDKPHGVRVFLQPDNLLTDAWIEVILDPNHYSWHNLKVTDFNLDGHLDIVAAISAVGVDDAPGESKVWPGNGDGTFKTSISIGSKIGYQGEVGDFNGDGLPDFFLPKHFQSGPIRAYQNISQ